MTSPLHPRQSGEMERLLRLTLQRLVDLKDGPRDYAYRTQKDDAWESARRVLALKGDVDD
jgi:hypothetical protein